MKSITLDNGKTAKLIARNNNGWFVRYGEGEYPWSSSVVLEGETNGSRFKWRYPTEINPRGQLGVDLDERLLLDKLAAQPLALIKWTNIYPREWSVSSVADCQVIGSLTLSYVKGISVQLKVKFPDPGMNLGSLFQCKDWVNIEESVLIQLQQEEARQSAALVEKHTANFAAFLESDEPGSYYPMWSPSYDPNPEDYEYED